MGDEPDLDPDINKDFFENNVLQLDPSLLTENGMKCFERFFKAVNCREGKLVAKRRAYMMDDLELIGLDYLWRVRRFVTQGTQTTVFCLLEISTFPHFSLWTPFISLEPKLECLSWSFWLYHILVCVVKIERTIVFAVHFSVLDWLYCVCMDLPRTKVLTK